MSERPDQELVQLAQRGDRAAIGELFSRYWRAARAAAVGVTGEFASAEDAAAEAFEEALAGIGLLRNPDRFGSWLRTIVVRKARLAHQRTSFAIDAMVNLSDPKELPDEALSRIELAVLLQQAIRELPTALREAMALVYFEGYDPSGAAQFLDIPSGTLRRRLHDGRGRVRETVEQLLQGRKKMNDERDREIARLKTMIDSDEIYQVVRGSLALRPAPAELMDMLLRRNGSPAELFRGAEDLLRPSDRVSDPAHPAGSIAAAIRKALPDFKDWNFDAGEAAARFFSGDRRDRLQATLPPGFAEGVPGAFIRGTRSLVSFNEGGPAQTVYELFKGSPDEQTFTNAARDFRISDVLDLTWMTASPLELRSVQALLERLTSAVLPGTQVRFSHYDEPRYRSALQLYVGEVSARAAYGGVLAEWPGRPSGVDAAHLRIFLEPWATVESGQVVEFAPMPQLNRVTDPRPSEPPPAEPAGEHRP